MNRALKQWVDLLAEKETAFRNKTILNDEPKEGLKLSKNTKLKLKIENLKFLIISHKQQQKNVKYLFRKNQNANKNQVAPILPEEKSGLVQKDAEETKDLENNINELLMKKNTKEIEAEEQIHSENKKNEDLMNDINNLIQTK